MMLPFQPLLCLLGISAAAALAALTAAGIALRNRAARIRALEEAVKSEHEQREAHFQAFTLYFQAFHRTQHGMMILDPEGCIRVINQAVEQMYGLPADQLMGRKIDELLPDPETFFDLGFSPDEGQMLIHQMWDAVRAPDVGAWERVIPQKRGDARVIWVRATINAIRDLDGAILHFILIPIDVTHRQDEEFRIRMEIYRAISDLAEHRDNETGRHLERVSYYSRRLAEQMRLPHKFCEDIAVFAPLHDIGKVGIIDRILLSPRKFTPEEFEIMKKHTTIGHDILKNKPTLEMAAEITLSHQEKFDGTGYPHGLRGEDIPLSARIVAVADVYDALRSRRPYKDPWPHERAMSQICGESGTHFDPRVVEAFLQVEGEFRVFSQQNADEPEPSSAG